MTIDGRISVSELRIIKTESYFANPAAFFVSEILSLLVCGRWLFLELEPHHTGSCYYEMMKETSNATFAKPKAKSSN